MQKKFLNKKVAFICHLLLAVFVLPLLIFYRKEESLLFINGHNSPQLDVFMYHITRLPEISFVVFVIFLGMFTQRRYFLAIVASLILCVLVIVFSKYFLFSDALRPYSWLNANKVPFHHVDGISMHSNGSFPSGHTMAAFCALALAGFISSNGLVQFLFFVLALLAGYSRVYVAQHYLVDVYAGSLTGFTLAYVVFSLVERKFSTLYWQKPLIKI